MRILFMGTPEFSVKCLESLVNSKHEVTAVVTREDKPRGRGHKLTPPPVKEFAVNNNIRVYQPSTLKDEAFINELKAENPDVIVVAAYGKILPQYILNYPKYRCINVHASLLPKYRGAAPIQRCIIEGETKTGITTMLMEQGLDTGDMILKGELSIGEYEKADSLHDRLADLGAHLILETLDRLEDGTAQFIKQNNEQACYAETINSQTGHIDFENNYIDIINLIRGVNAFTYYEGKKMKVITAYKAEKANNTQFGKILSVTKDGILVTAKDGNIIITEIQMEGSKKMPVSEYIKGHKIEVNTIFDN